LTAMYACRGYEEILTHGTVHASANRYNHRDMLNMMRDDGSGLGYTRTRYGNPATMFHDTAEGEHVQDDSLYGVPIEDILESLRPYFMRCKKNDTTLEVSTHRTRELCHRMRY
jgi:hypothetical protein